MIVILVYYIQNATSRVTLFVFLDDNAPILMPCFCYSLSIQIIFLSFLGVRKFTAALDYFQQAITLPAQALSAIVIACLKASKLASLIESGTAYEVPK